MELLTKTPELDLSIIKQLDFENVIKLLDTYDSYAYNRSQQKFQ